MGSSDAAGKARRLTQSASGRPQGVSTPICSATTTRGCRRPLRRSQRPRGPLDARGSIWQAGDWRSRRWQPGIASARSRAPWNAVRCRRRSHSNGMGSGTGSRVRTGTFVREMDVRLVEAGVETERGRERQLDEDHRVERKGPAPGRGSWMGAVMVETTAYSQQLLVSLNELSTGHRKCYIS